jgi:hypothetical protein
VPLRLGRARRGQGAREGPRRGAAAAGPRGQRSCPARRRCLRRAVRRARRALRGGEVQRLRGAAELRRQRHGARASLDPRRGVRRPARARARGPEPVGAGVLGRQRAGGRHVPHLEPPVAGDERRLRAAPDRAGEAQRPDRGERGGPSHAGRAPRWRRRPHPERRELPHLRPRRAAARLPRRRRLADVHRTPRRPQGLPVLLEPAGPRRAPPLAPAAGRRAGDADRCAGPAAAAARPRGVPRARQRRGQGARVPLRRRVRRPTPAGESFGIVLLEAMASGTLCWPATSTPSTGCSTTAGRG